MSTSARATDHDQAKADSHLSSLPSQEDSFSIFELLIVLAQSKRVILWATLGSAVLAVALSYVFRPQFTATTILLPPQQSGNSSAAILAQLGEAGGSTGGTISGTALGIKNPLDMYVSLLKCETVENAVINRFGLQNDFHETHLSVARRILEKKTTIEAGPKDGLIRLAFTDHDPVKAAQIANGYVDEYRKFSAGLVTTEAGQRRVFFEQQLEAEKEKLIGAEEDLKRTELATGLVDIDSQSRALIQSAATLRAEVAAKEVQIASMQTYAASGNPDLQQAQKELSSLQGELSKLGGNDSGDNLMTTKGRLPQEGLQYVRKLREVKYNETLFAILAKQYEVARLDESKEGAPIQIVDVAATPDRKSFPSRALFLLIGLIAGALFSSLWAIVRAELKDDVEAQNRWMTLKRALVGGKI